MVRKQKASAAPPPNAPRAFHRLPLPSHKQEKQPRSRQDNSAGRPTVLGLPTGSTPVGLYRELVRLHREAGLDFSRVVTFNLDEYYPMQPDDPQSYNRWMRETFFEHVNIPP